MKSGVAIETFAIAQGQPVQAIRPSLNQPAQHRYPKIRTTLILGKQQAMTQALPKPITFEQFLEWKPEAGRYELHDGTIIEMQPTGEDEEVKGFLATKLTVEFDRLNLPYFIPNQALVKPPEKESGYLPDVLILNRTNLAAEPLWKKSSTVTQGASIPLVIEVVSTNWRDDYLLKVADYEVIGVPEYWIVDYLGLGGRRLIGNPKQPTISVYSLVEGEYQVSQFRGADCIESPAFPELKLTAEQVFRVGALPEQQEQQNES